MKSILLVGRDNMPEAGLSGLFNSAGFKVSTEADYHSMLFLLASGMSIDLVIMDDHALDRNCTRFLESARQIAPDVPFIVMTSQGSILDYLQSLSLGAYEYIHKPIADRELIRIVRAATGATKIRTVSAAAS